MPDLLVSLVVFAVVATATPGGATTLAAASGAQFGFARSIPLVGGIAIGLAALTAMAGGGLATVVQSVPALQMGVRIAGSGYLLWLAWTIGRLGAPAPRARAASLPMGFFNGLLLLWLNPKGWTMAIAAASAYSGLSDDPLRLAILLGAAFGLTAMLSLTLWCMGGQWLSCVMKTETQWRAVNVALGLLLAASVVPMWR